MTKSSYWVRKLRSTMERECPLPITLGPQLLYRFSVCDNALKFMTTATPLREDWPVFPSSKLTDIFDSYKVTKGLLDRFGDKRVIDSPITESGFCGLTVGAALAGLHPVVSPPFPSVRNCLDKPLTLTRQV